MPNVIDEPAEQLGQIIRRCIRVGFPVGIDGLGTFRLARDGTISFVAQESPRVFIAYVAENYPLANRLSRDLRDAGFNPWLDKERLLPGQDWPRCIERAISISDFIVPCFSRRALVKRGPFQREIRLAFRYAAEMPIDDTYLIPVRLEECELPARLRSQYQHVDLFPEWSAGRARLIEAITAEMRSRALRR